ncbi:hypothetical protein SteCoe_18787 [Stentor coeruleus]|uniref:Uncharacterized protein n=1 Tax=Stentor coeruleus TaxID=5963 RepID=A0A1R2BVU2_9CILI|nr:hypothetical protein SteCoe_18787 [Stentor coeruleus]
MNSSKKNLSIDTSFSIPSEAFSTIAETSEIISSQDESQFFDIDSIDSFGIDDSTEKIIKSTNKICKAVCKRMEAHHNAIINLELFLLQKEADEIKNFISKIENTLSTSKNQENCIRPIPKKNSVSRHDLFLLKEKLKEAKNRSKEIKTEKKFITNENNKLKSVLMEKSLHFSQTESACDIF